MIDVIPEPIAPLYSVLTQKVSGEWTVCLETREPAIAAMVEQSLRALGAAVRIELIERPIP